MLPADLTYCGASLISNVFVITTSAITCSVCLCYLVNVSFMCLEVNLIDTLCFIKFLITSNGDKAADEAIDVKNGVYVVFQPPVYQYS